MLENKETLDIDIDDLFKDTEELDNKAPEQVVDDAEKDKEIMTKAVSDRINTVRRKTEAETQDKIAMELGYNNYAELQKANEAKLLKDAGLDEAELTGVVDKLVEKRIAADPRMKRLEEYEAREKNAFVESQLNEINKLTGNNFTSVEQLPKDTLELWGKTGNLKQAYLATQGEELLMKSQKHVGSLAHLGDIGTSGVGTKKRVLTDAEKDIWRSVLGDSITEEELSKKTVDID